MPGNEVGDRVHNFFAEDSLSQGQHHTEVGGGSWPVPGNNQWPESQRHTGLPSSKGYNLQQLAVERGHSNHPFPVSDGLNLTQSILRPEFAKSQFQSQQPIHSNGYVHGRQMLQTRQYEANFLGVDTESDRHNVNSRGLSFYEAQQENGPGNHTSSLRSESSESPVSFDFFGSQQQMHVPEAGMLQPLPQQQAAFNDMQQLQQQVVLRKMQELQRQQQIQQLEARQQNDMNQIPAFTKQASGNYSPAIINGTPISPVAEASNYRWATELTTGNSNWMQRATPAMQGSSNGFRFSPDQGQTLSLMGLAPHQVDQSLYGVPISSTRGSPQPYSQTSQDKPPMAQVAMQSNSFPGNQHTGVPDQVRMHGGSWVSTQGFQGEKIVGHTSGQGLNSRMSLENLPQVNALQRNASAQEFHEMQELAGPSETLQDRTMLQVSSSQNVVGLDPTEEKILFGDDNIWDAFGSSANMVAGGLNTSKGTGSLSGLPSLHSGSWSALMQSAVAETSSNDTRNQEVWSGLGFHITEDLAGDGQPSRYGNNTKHQEVLTGNKLQIASGLSFGSVPLSDGANSNRTYRDVPGIQKPGQEISQVERLQMDSTHMSLQHSSKEGSNCISRGPLQLPLAEGSQTYGNANAEFSTKNIYGSWTPQQSMSSYNSGELHNKPNGRSVGESIPHSGDVTSKIHGNENHLRHLNYDQKEMKYEEMSHGGHIWKANSGPKSIFGMEHIKSSTGSQQVIREDYSLSNVSAIPKSSTTPASQDTSKLFLNGHLLNYLNHADSSMKSQVNDISGRSQHHMKGPQALDSSINSFDKDTVITHELDISDRKENSSDSHRTNLSQHTATGGSRENVWSDGSDSRNMPAGKQKSSGLAGQKMPGSRKFQYHPMGNLDEDMEPSYRMNVASQSQVMSPQIPRASYGLNQGYFGQSNFFGQLPETSTDRGKGHSPDIQGNKNVEDEAPSKSTRSGFAPNPSAPFDRSVGIHGPNKASQSSQNMLELLQKVDQSKECGNSDGSVVHLQQNQSSASQGFGLQLAPPSQRLPLRDFELASQNSAETVSFSASHTSPEMRDKGHTWLASIAQVQSLPSSHGTSQGEVKNDRNGMPGEAGNGASKYSMQGSSEWNTGFPHSRSQLLNQQMISARGKVETNDRMNASSDRHASSFQPTGDSASRALAGQPKPASLRDTAGVIPRDKTASFGNSSWPTDSSQSNQKTSVPQLSVGRASPSSQFPIASGNSQLGPFPKMVPKEWTAPGQQLMSGSQSHKFPPSTFQSSQSNNSVTGASSKYQEREGHDCQKGGSGPAEIVANSMASESFSCGEGQLATESLCQLVSSGSTDLAVKMSASQEKESVVKNLSESSPSNSASSQRDIEAFGRSLKPNNLMHQKYSLLHQMRAMKSTEIDPSYRDLKRFKGEDSGDGCQMAPKAGQLLEHNVVVGDTLVHRSAVPSGDSKVLSFSGPMDTAERNASSQLGNLPSQNVLPFDQKDSVNDFRSNSTSSVRVENSPISPQMAPSWFNQFGTFKNGQMLSVYDARKNATINTLEQPYTLGNSADGLRTQNSLEHVNAAADSNQAGNMWRRSADSTPMSVAVELSSPQSLLEDVTEQHLAVVRPKKRKSVASELLPWHKEVTRGSGSPLTTSMAEADWAKAANRLIDKVEVEAEMLEDGSPMPRSKRRLILTTQLMQQLFRPPPAAVLSADAGLTYKTVAYLVARLASGDACSLNSSSDLRVPLDDTDLLSDKRKTSEKIGGQNLPKVVEDFISRARNLENDFMSLDKRASVLDLRIECQELTKFSVINRFAKYHGRGQADGAETSSSSDALRLSQRYVTALPGPRNLPDRVQCLSL